MARTKGARNLTVRELRKEAKRLQQIAALKERLEKLTAETSGKKKSK
jgi:hypothetical protein